MIVGNNGCVTKSKLTITVKTRTKYNDPRRVAAKQTNEQIQRDRNQDVSRKHTKGGKKHTYKQRHKQTYCGHTHRES